MAAQTLTLLDKRLLELAAQGASPEEMALDTGLPGGAQEAYTRVAGILKQRDVWGEIQQRQLLLHSAFAIKGQLERWLDSSPNFSKDQVTAYLQTLRLLSDILERHTNATKDQMDKVVDAHKMFLIGMVEKLSQVALDNLHAKHPDIDLVEIDGVFQEAISKERLNVGG